MKPGEGTTSPREIRHSVVGETPMIRASSASLSIPFARRSSSSLIRRNAMHGALSSVNDFFMHATLPIAFNYASLQIHVIEVSRRNSGFFEEDSLHACNGSDIVEYMSDTVNYRENWAAYLRHMMAERSQAEFAKAIQATDGQLSKWLSGTTGVTAEKVMTIARLLGDSPVHALARVGWINTTEIARFQVPRTFGLEEFSDRELAAEIVRRIDAGEAGKTLTEPIDASPLELNAHRERKANVPTAKDTIDHVETPDLDVLDYAAKRGTRKADAAPWAE